MHAQIICGRRARAAVLDRGNTTTMGLGIGRFASPESSLVFAALRNQNALTSSFGFPMIALSFLPPCGLYDGPILLMAQRDSPTLRSVPTSQGRTKGTQRDHAQAKEHKHEGRHWVAVAVGSQGSPVDFSRDLEEGKKALTLVTGCFCAAEKLTMADGN